MSNPRILFVVACTWVQKGCKVGQDQKIQIQTKFFLQKFLQLCEFVVDV